MPGPGLAGRVENVAHRQLPSEAEGAEQSVTDPAQWTVSVVHDWPCSEAERQELTGS